MSVHAGRLHWVGRRECKRLCYLTKPSKELSSFVVASLGMARPPLISTPCILHRPFYEHVEFEDGTVVRRHRDQRVTPPVELISPSASVPVTSPLKQGGPFSEVLEPDANTPVITLGDATSPNMAQAPESCSTPQEDISTERSETFSAPLLINSSSPVDSLVFFSRDVSCFFRSCFFLACIELGGEMLSPGTSFHLT